jgi:cobalt-zinc-cadmium resistance protein CzcA
VLEAVERNNANVGGAYIEHANEQYILRGMGLVNSVEDIGNIVIKTGKEAVPIYVDDVADIRVAAAVRQGAMTSDGQGEAVGGIAMMLKDDNSRLVAERVDERIQQIRKTLPAGVELRTFYNRSDLVNRTLSTVQHNLMAGAGLVVLVLILLLGNLRGALLVASVIPLSMLCAVICMVACGVSGNLMSLGAVDFGLIVDGAVVVVENILRRLAERQHEKLNESTETTILKACIEIGRPVVFAVAIIIIVYLPILSLVGIEGKMFRPMALTVVFCLISSLILSLTYIPAAMTFLFKHSISEKESLIIRCAKRLYQPTLNAAIHHGKVIAVAALGLFLIASTMLPFLGAEFMPRLDEGAISLQTTQLPSVSLTQSISALTDVERIVKSFPEVTKVVSRIGRAEVATDPMGVDAADVYVGLKPESQWTSARNRDELISKMKKHLDDEVPTVNIGFMQPIEQRTSELISGVRSDVAIKIFGDDLDELRRTAQRVSQVISHIKGAFDVKVEQTAGLLQ